jgi:hypothetical protein
MAKRKTTKNKTKPRATVKPKVSTRKPTPKDTWWSKLSDETRMVLTRSVVWTIALVGLLFLGGWGAAQMEQYVLAGTAQHGTVPHYRLVDAPRDLGTESIRAIGETFKVPAARFEDEDLLAKVHARVAASPWVSRVNRITKHVDEKTLRGVVVIDCEYRRPVARILLNPGRANQTDTYISADGVRLPSNQVPKYRVDLLGPDGRTVRRIYTSRSRIPENVAFGILHYPSIVGGYAGAPEVGASWQGRDVADAIRLAMLLERKNYYTKIAKIDVSEYARRGDLVLHAGRTRILFGKFPTDEDDLHTVRPERKVECIDHYANATGGNLGGLHSEIDVRDGSVSVSLD